MTLDQRLSYEHFTAKEKVPEVGHQSRVSWCPLCSAPVAWEHLQRQRSGTHWQLSSQLPPVAFSALALCIEQDLAGGSFAVS